MCIGVDVDAKRMFHVVNFDWISIDVICMWKRCFFCCSMKNKIVERWFTIEKRYSMQTKSTHSIEYDEIFLSILSILWIIQEHPSFIYFLFLFFLWWIRREQMVKQEKKREKHSQCWFSAMYCKPSRAIIPHIITSSSSSFSSSFYIRFRLILNSVCVLLCDIISLFL